MRAAAACRQGEHMLRSTCIMMHTTGQCGMSAELLMADAAGQCVQGVQVHTHNVTIVGQDRIVCCGLSLSGYLRTVKLDACMHELMASRAMTQRNTYGQDSYL